MARVLNLFESALSRARVVRQGDLVQVIVDGGGAFVTYQQEFMQAQKWAQSKTASGNWVTDRGRLFERINTLISRPGSAVSTRGHGKYIENLARSMNQAGYELSEWMLPPELKNLGNPRFHVAAAKAPLPHTDAEGAAPLPPAPPRGDEKTGQ